MISRNGSKYLNFNFFKYLYVSLVVAHGDCSLTKKGSKQSRGIFVYGVRGVPRIYFANRAVISLALLPSAISTPYGVNLGIGILGTKLQWFVGSVCLHPAGGGHP